MQKLIFIFKGFNGLRTIKRITTKTRTLSESLPVVLNWSLRDFATKRPICVCLDTFLKEIS